jgi:hypothetical protein
LIDARRLSGEVIKLPTGSRPDAAKERRSESRDMEIQSSCDSSGLSAHPEQDFANEDAQIAPLA